MKIRDTNSAVSLRPLHEQVRARLKSEAVGFGSDLWLNAEANMVKVAETLGSAASATEYILRVDRLLDSMYLHAFTGCDLDTLLHAAPSLVDYKKGIVWLWLNGKRPPKEFNPSYAKELAAHYSPDRLAGLREGTHKWSHRIAMREDSALSSQMDTRPKRKSRKKQATTKVFIHVFMYQGFVCILQCNDPNYLNYMDTSPRYFKGNIMYEAPSEDNAELIVSSLIASAIAEGNDGSIASIEIAGCRSEGGAILTYNNDCSLYDVWTGLIDIACQETGKNIDKGLYS